MTLCAAYAFVDTTKKNWRNKSTPKKIRNVLDRPGSKTSCNHLISHEPGIIPQITGILTYQWYAMEIIFSGNQFNFTYTRLIKITSLEEIMLAKIFYKRVAGVITVAL